MKQQNFSNHTRLVKGFHGLLFALILLFLVLSIFYTYTHFAEEPQLWAILVLLNPILILFMWFSRTFALKAQDRAIRAEERFRYYLLTQKALPSELRLSQIIALRFAPDDEFPELVERALKENLSATEIKKTIKHWKADYHRV